MEAQKVSADERCDWIRDREAWRQTLADPPVPDFLTGLNLRYPDPRDFSLAEVPGVAAQLAVGFPETADLLKDWQGPVLNQGAVPSCVCHTMAHQQSILQWREERVARVFHAPRAHTETGPENQGRWPDDILKYCRDKGMPLTGSEARYRIKSYAFAPKTSPQAWADTIKASIASGRPVPICLLLPAQFGWESSGAITSGYHEVLIIGYRRDAFLILNSWGSGWGRDGLGWVSIEFLAQNNWQNGYVIAHSGVEDEILVTPQPQPNPQPNPNPSPAVTKANVAGRVEGGVGVGQMAVGTPYSVTGVGVNTTLILNSHAPITDPDPPSPLAVTGYSANPVKPGQLFAIQGRGFGNGVLVVSWGGQVLQSSRISDASLTATAPANTGENPVQVRLEGLTVFGPPLKVAADTQPQPGALKVVVSRVRYAIIVTATADGRYVNGTAEATINGRALPVYGTNRCTALGQPASFRLAGMTGQVQVTVTADDGRQGTASVGVSEVVSEDDEGEAVL